MGTLVIQQDAGKWWWILTFASLSHMSQCTLLNSIMLLQSNRENHEYHKYFCNVIVLQEKSQTGVRKLNYEQER